MENKALCLHPGTLKNLTQKAIQVVTEAGNFLKETAITHIEQKEGHANFVTDMDVRVQEKLVAGFTGLLPDASFLLEESDAPDSFSEYIWIIDPIDGTQNFICQNRLSAIAVGLVHKESAPHSARNESTQEGLLGIVYNPFLEELYVGIKGQGATLNGMPIKPSHTPLATAIISMGTAPYYTEFREPIIKAFQTLYPLCGDFRRFGSAALELCYAACGKVDGYFEYRLSPWDYAAASIILKEAGGKVETIDESPWDYTQSKGMIAGNPVLFEELKKALT